VTLLETMLTTIIVGTAVLALVRLTFVLIQNSATTQRATVGLMLTDNVREMMAELPFNDPRTGSHLNGPNATDTTLASYNDIQDFQGFTANPPVDANRQPITALGKYQQRITVTLIGDNYGHSLNGVTNNLGAVVARVTVSIDYQSGSSWTTVATMSWLRGKS
jgi:hypothetical protein